MYVGEWLPLYRGLRPMVDGGKGKVKTAYDIPDESAVPIDIVSTGLVSCFCIYVDQWTEQPFKTSPALLLRLLAHRALPAHQLCESFAGALQELCGSAGVLMMPCWPRSRCGGSCSGWWSGRSFRRTRRCGSRRVSSHNSSEYRATVGIRRPIRCVSTNGFLSAVRARLDDCLAKTPDVPEVRLLAHKDLATFIPT